MLCERCHEREAIVHVTRCYGDTGEVTKHDFCEACATDPEAGGISMRELRGWKSYDRGASGPPPQEDT